MFSVGEGTTRRRVGGRDTGRRRVRPLSRRAGSDRAGGGRIGLRVVRRRQTGAGPAARYRQPRPRLHCRGAGLGAGRAGLAGDPAFPQQELGPSGPARLCPGSRRRSTDPRPAGALDRRSRPAPGRSDALRPCQPPDRARCRHLARPVAKGPRPGRRARGHPGRLARAAGRDWRFSHTMASRPHHPDPAGGGGARRRSGAGQPCHQTRALPRQRRRPLAPPGPALARARRPYACAPALPAERRGMPRPAAPTARRWLRLLPRLVAHAGSPATAPPSSADRTTPAPARRLRRGAGGRAPLPG